MNEEKRKTQFTEKEKTKERKRKKEAMRKKLSVKIGRNKCSYKK